MEKRKDQEMIMEGSRKKRRRTGKETKQRKPAVAMEKKDDLASICDMSNTALCTSAILSQRIKKLKRKDMKERKVQGRKGKRTEQKERNTKSIWRRRDMILPLLRHERHCAVRISHTVAQDEKRRKKERMDGMRSSWSKWERWKTMHAYIQATSATVCGCINNDFSCSRQYCAVCTGDYKSSMHHASMQSCTCKSLCKATCKATCIKLPLVSMHQLEPKKVCTCLTFGSTLYKACGPMLLFHSPFVWYFEPKKKTQNSSPWMFESAIPTYTHIIICKDI